MNEALSKAIEALERIAETNASKHGTTPMMLERCLSTAREALSALSALQEARPVAWMYQHEETGRIGFVDDWQLQNGWEKGNPRLHIIKPLYAHPQPAQQDARPIYYLQRKGCGPEWEDFTPGHGNIDGALACVRYAASTPDRPLRILEVKRRVAMDQSAIDAALAAAKEKQ